MAKHNAKALLATRGGASLDRDAVRVDVVLDLSQEGSSVVVHFACPCSRVPGSR